MRGCQQRALRDRGWRNVGSGAALGEFLWERGWALQVSVVVLSFSFSLFSLYPECPLLNDEHIPFTYGLLRDTTRHGGGHVLVLR